MKPKVFFIIPSLGAGGAERVTTTLLQHLSSVKFSVTLVVIDSKRSVFIDEIPPQIKLICLNYTRVLYSIPKLLQILWVNKPDVIFSTLSHLNIIISALRPLLPRKAKYLARETSIVSSMLAEKKSGAIWRAAYRYFYPTFDRVICQSEFMKQDLGSVLNEKCKNLTVINNPIDVTKIRVLRGKESENGNRAVSEPIQLISVGRLSYEKGFDILLRALKLCPRRTYHLSILGSGPLESELKSLAKDLGIDSEITFYGYVKNPYPYISASDALILSSRHEGFPNVVLESLACETPVITTPAVGGVREILERTNGGVVAEEVSAKALANAICQFDWNMEIPVESLDSYSVDKIVKEYELIFSDVLSNDR